MFLVARKIPTLAVAQRQERRAVNAKTMGSIPSSRPNTKAKEKERDDRQISKDKGGKRDDTLGAATSSLERKGMTRSKRAKYHIRTRRFLNREPEFPAYIIAVVEDTSDIPDDDRDQSWNWGDVQLDLGDCYRRVSFDFSMSTAEERANSLNKINRIAKTVNAVRDAIEKEVHSRNARPQPPDKSEK